MHSLYFFNGMPLVDRAQALWEHGTFLGASDHENGRSAWYTLSDYFVEVLMAGDQQRIAEVTPFRTGERLERMLSVVYLADLE